VTISGASYGLAKNKLLRASAVRQGFATESCWRLGFRTASAYEPRGSSELELILPWNFIAWAERWRFHFESLSDLAGFRFGEDREVGRRLLEVGTLCAMQFERAMIRDRVMSGLERAREQSKTLAAAHQRQERGSNQSGAATWRHRRQENCASTWRRHWHCTAHQSGNGGKLGRSLKGKHEHCRHDDHRGADHRRPDRLGRREAGSRLVGATLQ
jgi:hypothetical protein